MADDVKVPAAETEPAGELIHLPGPSYQPVVLAAGVALAVIGVVLSLILVVIGVLIAAIALVRWIGDTRREMSELPLEH